MENLLDVVSGVLNDRAEKLYEYEVALKNDYGMNDKTRASMNDKVREYCLFHYHKLYYRILIIC